jgi:hypothetical protein
LFDRVAGTTSVRSVHFVCTLSRSFLIHVCTSTGGT